VFERFTERARQVVVLAQDEGRALKHNYIGTEHLLLGLLRVEEGLAARILASLDITVEEVRAQVARVVGFGDHVATGQIPFTPRAKKVLELSLREALSLGHNYIGSEHILLGLMREDDGVAARILLDFGADAETVRNEVVRMLSGPGRVPDAEEPVEFPPELAERIDEVRREKEAAIDSQDFERAAELRGRERDLVREARGMPPLPPRKPSAFVAVPEPRPRTGTRDGGTLIPALLVAAAGFPLGLLAGWAIWG
jgi:Clp amino terminal domain, pathogenicity island component/UvrB/uvrC motif